MKRGFNLIEIAIVLAVVGLVIGGIYTAASAVTENNRQQKLQKQILTIVSNIRTAYNMQSGQTMPTYTEAQAMQVFPADMPGNGTGFMNAYGGRSMVYTSAVTGDFELDLYGISQQGCTKLLVSQFGNAAQNAAYGANLVVNMSNGSGATASDGITPSQAATVCSSSTNNLLLTFHLH